MKLMLTSAGVTNKSLENALKQLVKGKIKMAFIPTAANIEEGDKDWLITDLNNCRKLGEVDIVDISALEKDVWLSRLEKANVIFVGGGNTVYLMVCVLKSGLDKELKELLKTRVYVGISAGSVVLSKTLFASSEFLYDDEDGKEHEGLGYVNFHVRPHLNSKHFPKVRDEFLKELASKIEGTIYALDDSSAVVYDSGKIEIISEGKWIKYN
ncbi:Peptidase E [subsurface metagenome]